jgi:hypothetical protein
MASELRIRWDSSNPVKYSVLDASAILIGQKSYDCLQNYHSQTRLDNDKRTRCHRNSGLSIDGSSSNVPILATMASRFIPSIACVLQTYVNGI